MDEGRMDEGRMDEGRMYEGRMDEGRMDEGRWWMKGGGARAGLSRRPIFRVKRMVGWEVLREEVLEIGGAGLAGLALGVVGAGFVVEVAGAGDVGILKGGGPAAELAGAALGEGFQI